MAGSDSSKNKGRGKKTSSSGGGEGGLSSLFGDALDKVSSRAIKYASSTAGLVSGGLLKTPERLELMGKAGSALKDMRNTAGLSIEELSNAIDLENPDILRAVEEGKTGLPMDILMRLASYYSRNDPLPFIIRFSRTYHPWMTQWLSITGMDRLMLKAERELKFLKIYSNVDEARELSDEGFDRVLEFTRQAFNMALHFAAEQEQLAAEMAGAEDPKAKPAKKSGKTAVNERAAEVPAEQAGGVEPAMKKAGVGSSPVIEKPAKPVAEKASASSALQDDDEAGDDGDGASR